MPSSIASHFFPLSNFPLLSLPVSLSLSFVLSPLSSYLFLFSLPIYLLSFVLPLLLFLSLSLSLFALSLSLFLSLSLTSSVSPSLYLSLSMSLSLSVSLSVSFSVCLSPSLSLIFFSHFRTHLQKINILRQHRRTYSRTLSSADWENQLYGKSRLSWDNSTWNIHYNGITVASSQYVIVIFPKKKSAYYKTQQPLLKCYLEII